jgi:DNA mismatch repair ATPase MutS
MSWKSTYIKAVSFFSFACTDRMFVPAKGMKLSIVDRVLQGLVHQ